MTWGNVDQLEPEQDAQFWTDPRTGKVFKKQSGATSWSDTGVQYEVVVDEHGTLEVLRKCRDVINMLRAEMSVHGNGHLNTESGHLSVMLMRDLFNFATGDGYVSTRYMKDAEKNVNRLMISEPFPRLEVHPVLPAIETGVCVPQAVIKKGQISRICGGVAWPGNNEGQIYMNEVDNPIKVWLGAATKIHTRLYSRTYEGPEEGLLSEGSDNGMVIVGPNLGAGTEELQRGKCLGKGWGASVIVNSLLQHQSATGASVGRKKIMKKNPDAFVGETWNAHATMNTWAAPFQPVGLQGSNGASDTAMILNGVAFMLGGQTLLPVVIKEIAEVNDSGVTRVQAFLA